MGWENCMQTKLFSKASRRYENYRGNRKRMVTEKRDGSTDWKSWGISLEKKVNEQVERQETWLENLRFPTVTDDEKI